MQGKGDKKLTVTTKTMAMKKPSLQIKIPHQNDQTKTAPNTFSTFKEEKGGKCPTISTVTSPTHFKNIHPISQIPESVKESPKRKGEPITIQKRGSGKETPSPKVQIQPRMASTQLGSPKAVFNKEKVMISYGSEKNLNNIKPIERRQTPRKTHNRIEELQKLLNAQKTKTSTLMNREDELVKDNDTLKKQNSALKDEVAELQKKIQRFKVSNREIKKMLKQRINSFNQQGGELQALREQVQTLQARVNSLLTENQTLKMQLNKYECDNNLSFLKDIKNQCATSMVREVVPLSGSRICGQYLKQSQNGDDFKVFEGMDGMEEDLDLQSYITEKQQSYLVEYKANMNVFDKIKQEYEDILASIELRYKNLSEDYEATIANQAAEIYELEAKIDELREGDKGGNMADSRLSIDVDEVILRAQDEIAKQNLALFELKASNRDLTSEVEQKSAQCKFLQAELQVQALKKRFKDENDKFEFNVAKLNLLNIIDKLKLRVDREKEKYDKFRARVSSVE